MFVKLNVIRYEKKTIWDTTNCLFLHVKISIALKTVNHLQASLEMINCFQSYKRVNSTLSLILLRNDTNRGRWAVWCTLVKTMSLSQSKAIEFAPKGEKLSKDIVFDTPLVKYIIIIQFFKYAYMRKNSTNAGNY